MEFKIHLLNSILEGNGIVLDSLETCLVQTGEDRFMLEALIEKLNAISERMISKAEKRSAMRQHLFQGSMCSSKEYAANVVNMTMNKTRQSVQ